MEETIKKYMKQEREKLVRGEVDKLRLEGVCPSYVVSVFGGFEDSLDLNGWQGDYWGETDEGFTVTGCMYYGTATITITEEE